MNRLIILKVLLTIFIFIRCIASITDSIIPTKPKILFEVECINYAWGWMHYGRYIDNSGKLYSYSYLNKNYEDRWKPQRSGIYTESELLEKFSHSKEFVKQIDYNELIQMANLIPAASKGKLSDTVSVGADAGSITYKGYLYDGSKNEYIEVILRVEGDWYIENLLPTAKIIADWLMAVTKK